MSWPPARALSARSAFRLQGTHRSVASRDFNTTGLTSSEHTIIRFFMWTAGVAGISGEFITYSGLAASYEEQTIVGMGSSGSRVTGAARWTPPVADDENGMAFNEGVGVFAGVSNQKQMLSSGMDVSLIDTSTNPSMSEKYHYRTAGDNTFTAFRILKNGEDWLEGCILAWESLEDGV